MIMRLPRRQIQRHMRIIAIICRIMAFTWLRLQFEAMFISAAHTQEQLAQTLETARNYFKNN